MLDRVEVKAEAKSILRSAKVSPLGITFILLALCFVLERMVTLVETGSLFYTFSEDMYYALLEGDYETLLNLSSGNSAIGFFFSILVSLFISVLQGGYTIYSMGIRQGLHMPFATLFDGLAVAGKIILCTILMSIKIFLWSLLFFVPGIVAAYRYRFAIFNILTDGSLSASKAIQLSCKQTNGRKGQLFVLDLSFLGWNLLSTLTFGILDIWVMPYTQQCVLAYFEAAQKQLGRNPYGNN